VRGVEGGDYRQIMCVLRCELKNVKSKGGEKGIGRKGASGGMGGAWGKVTDRGGVCDARR